jgi:cytochrome oxidase Cu insertion factor (SCO1/SenC/PrrC family)
MKKMQEEMQNQSDLVGTKALGFSATDINGKEYSLDSLKGKIIVMNFWFIQCKPCIN